MQSDPQGHEYNSTVHLPMLSRIRKGCMQRREKERDRKEDISPVKYMDMHLYTYHISRE